MRKERIVLLHIERHQLLDGPNRVERVQKQPWCLSTRHQDSIIEFENVISV